MSKIGVIEAEEYIGILNADIIETSYQATDLVSVHLAAILALQANDNPITLGFVDGTLDLEVTVDFQDHPTLLKACLSIRNQVGGYLWAAADYDDPTIVKLRLEPNMGENKGQEIRYEKNIAGITRDSDGWQTATKIFPIGQANRQPLNLSAFFKEDEIVAKSSDASYGYLTLTAPYSYYKGWTAEGAAVPGSMLIEKNAVDNTQVWVQGSSGQVLRCDIGDYDGGATYTVSYTHADFVQTTPTGNMHPVGQLYPMPHIADPAALLLAAQTILDEWGTALVSYNVILPMISPAELDFDLLQLGSIVNVRDADFPFSAAPMIKRIRKPDMRHPERMELDLDRIHPLFGGLDSAADALLLHNSMRLYDTLMGIRFYGTGGTQLGGIQFTPTETYELHHVRLRTTTVGSFGPTVTVAIISSGLDYFDGGGVLAHSFIGPGMIATAIGWGLDIPLHCLLQEGVTYYITVHAPYGSAASNYIMWAHTYLGTNHGKNWTPESPGTGRPWPHEAVQLYGTPHLEI